jgi:cell division transport system permease protein
MLNSIKKIFKFSLENISRNKGLFFTTTLTVTMTTSLIVGLFVLEGATNSLVGHLQEKIDISVYFNPDVEEESIVMMREELARVPEITSVNYISREEALYTFIERHGNDPLIMESLEEIGDNPLVAHLNIKAAQASQYEQISVFLEKSSFRDLINKVDYHQNRTVIERIFSISNSIEKTSYLFIIISAFLAILVTFNTIRLGIVNLKREISVMRLVGASNWFIRGPFAFQGMISALLATIFTLIFFTGVCYFLSPKVETLVSGFSLIGYFQANIVTIILIQLGSAMGIAIIPSLVAIRKYLHT